MTIEYVIKTQKCCGCGTCAGICPVGAIDMKINERGFYIPNIDKKKCTNCGLCSKLCSQINEITNFNELNKFVFGKVSDDKIIGNNINCYVGCSTDENLRFEASSGGMVSQILISALDEGIIDGAIVTKMKKDNPLIPEPFIARTKEEIISAIGSKYCPVPVNIVLKKIIESKSDEKFAVVGLPCHIVGIRKAEMLIPKLQNKIILHLGLFCSGTESFFGTEFILKKKKIQMKKVNSIKYRGAGWPGYMQIKCTDRIVKISHHDQLYYGGIFPFFKNPTCLFCLKKGDIINELADISFGDAWGLVQENIGAIGTSIIVSRTDFGEKVLKMILQRNNIKLINLSKKNCYLHNGIKWKTNQNSILDRIYFQYMYFITRYLVLQNKNIQNFVLSIIYNILILKSKLFKNKPKN
ncbi:MAG: hypothetical protein BWK75_00925 [Candidatus Altiarchaeales archaeon A3]|nr:MAG: hypothetical protein BWK75_00925 [Candidatus Altiarchaeales archaeon A3]